MSVKPIGIRSKRRLAPADHILGLHVLGVVEAIREKARVVNLGIPCTEDEIRNRAARSVTRPAGNRVAVVRALQGGKAERVAVHNRLATGAAVYDDGARTPFFLDLGDVRHNDIPCLVPRDTFPLVFPPVFMGTLHGVEKAVGMIHVFHQVEHLAIQSTAVNRMGLVSFDLQQVAFCIHRVLHAPPDGMLARGRPRAASNRCGPIFVDMLPFVGMCHYEPPSLPFR